MQELRDYEFAQGLTKLNLNLCRVYRAAGIPETVVRAYYASLSKVDADEGASNSLWLQADPRKAQKQIEALAIIVKNRDRLLRINKGRVVLDEDSTSIYSNLIELEGIPLEDIFRETLRSRTESIELIKMQIDWFRTHPVIIEYDSRQLETDVKLDSVRVEETLETGAAEVISPKDKEPFSLLGLDLYWTKTHWSSDPHHLVQIPTSSRSKALQQFTDVSRGKISIKPSSIFRGLEFHMQKDVIQKALATRNKYGPEGIRDWVKIKRGKDRIFLLIPGEGKAIFFAGGRDEIYRDI